MKLTEYLITVKDVQTVLKKTANAFSLQNLIRMICLVALASIVYIFTGVGLEATIFFSLLCLLLFWRLDGRISIGLGLLCLILIMVCIGLFRLNLFVYGEIWSEQLAVWAFYFLSIGVITQVVELMRNPQTDLLE